ncbi:hypothetical protein OIU77_027432 [Salix suchowensis]|uniref:Ribosomal protein L36 n=1 Tax=Salix suchowensis TaxID=1278906 RepID=A0ABQ9BSU8_9ROSI|nr:hypothetical protein OIU77_027432 [Salix suchowensis]
MKRLHLRYVRMPCLAHCILVPSNVKHVNSGKNRCMLIWCVL